ncbi:hypothetical protein JOM56_005450 [Amanita muscaria]
MPQNQPQNRYSLLEEDAVMSDSMGDTYASATAHTAASTPSGNPRSKRARDTAEETPTLPSNQGQVLEDNMAPPLSAIPETTLSIAPAPRQTGPTAGADPASDDDAAGVPRTTYQPSPVTFLPAPENDYPQVDGLSAARIFEYIPVHSRITWDNTTGPKALVYIANGKVVTEAFLHVNKIREILGVALDSHNVQVSHARPHTLPPRGDRPIFPFLVSGISEEQCATLLEQRVWATQELAIFAIPYNVPNCEYTMTLHQLPLPMEERSTLEVRRIVREGIISSGDIQKFIQLHHDNTRIKKLRYPLTLSFIADSVRVFQDSYKINGGLAIPIYHVYIYPPSNSRNVHSNWLDILCRMQFTHPVGTAVTRSMERICKHCHSITHASTDCPFTRLDKWPVYPIFGGGARPQMMIRGHGGHMNPRGRGGRGRGRNGRGLPRHPV